MTASNGTTRRNLLTTGAAGALVISAPGLVRAQAAPVKLGILQPVTGALAQDGEYGRIGAQLAIDDINAAGGIKSLGGAKIEMVFGDARSSPEGGTQEVERMHSRRRGGSGRRVCLAHRACSLTGRVSLRICLCIVDVGVNDQIVASRPEEHVPLWPRLRRCHARQAHREPRQG